MDKFKCEFCKKEFITERSLINHLCEPKRRWLSKEEKHVRLGFQAWIRFLELTKSNKKSRLYTDFMESKQYINFVRLGRYIIATDMANPERFIEFIILNSVRVRDWQKNVVYDAYIKNLYATETPNSALQRFLKVADAWSIQTGENWVDFFRKVDGGLAVAYVKSGKISPWILLAADSAEYLKSRFSEEQKQIIDSFIDKKWPARLRKRKEEVNVMRSVLKDNGL